MCPVYLACATRYGSPMRSTGDYSLYSVEAWRAEGEIGRSRVPEVPVNDGAGDHPSIHYAVVGGI